MKGKSNNERKSRRPSSEKEASFQDNFSHAGDHRDNDKSGKCECLERADKKSERE